MEIPDVVAAIAEATASDAKRSGSMSPPEELN
jgi:hypothetical protein